MGISKRKAYRNAESGTWRKLHSGVFLTNPNLEGDELWKAELAGMLLSGGQTARVSHRSAAILHGFEGVSERSLDVTDSSSPREPSTRQGSSEPLFGYAPTGD